MPEQVFLVDLPNEYGFPFGSYAELENMDGRRRSRLRYVAGHMPIGVLDLFSNAFVFTALRDPVERALSDYWYCYHIAENPAHPFARQLSPGEFCRHGYVQAKNGIARYLSGAVYSDELMTDQEMRHKAIENLERFDLVGFQDDLQSLVKSLPIVDAGKIKMHGDRNAMVRLSTLSDEDIAIIKECTAVDRELYERAVSRATAGRQQAASAR